MTTTLVCRCLQLFRLNWGSVLVSLVAVIFIFTIQNLSSFLGWAAGPCRPLPCKPLDLHNLQCQPSDHHGSRNLGSFPRRAAGPRCAPALSQIANPREPIDLSRPSAAALVLPDPPRLANMALSLGPAIRFGQHQALAAVVMRCWIAPRALAMANPFPSSYSSDPFGTRGSPGFVRRLARCLPKCLSTLRY